MPDTTAPTGKAAQAGPEAAAAAPTSTDPPIGVEHFIESAAMRIPVAGLLAAKPELRDATMTREAWQAALDAHLQEPA